MAADSPARNAEPNQRSTTWVLIGAVAALFVTIAVSLWLAFAVSVDTVVEVDKSSGLIHIRGTEERFVGSVRGEFNGQPVLIEGLPVADEMLELPLAWRALCAVRDDPNTDWSKASEQLRSQLHTEEMMKVCRPFS